MIPKWKKLSQKGASKMGVSAVLIDKEGTYIVFGNEVKDLKAGRECVEHMKGREIEWLRFGMKLMWPGSVVKWSYEP